ncbi:isoprenylcysteine carboxylmethyltransferase family protein [Aestuariibacter halophilus]|uniref:Isoprenylcysteine carboxylmethyltransferase family protein n=1 Tax=Fluctibacter halophilus TaxID=226011 RepID=A0ABS8G6L1_9ALTE|nr:isoprenylcysteine carboxylmethyltransferase family protein [Aestuariibacter halophilus]MCC2616163.1 isoprenylcysteine carboxylmethyltransferase family protein [Aestuariibacter halophilus]
MKFFKLGYSVATYLFFLATFTYLVLFLGAGFLAEWVPLLSQFKTVDDGAVVFSVPAVAPWLSNVILLLAFSVHHSVMARLGIKQLLMRVIPASAERSTFVLGTCLILCWMYIGWQPQPGVIWSVDGVAKVAMVVSFLVGGGLVLWATFMISHWRLFGLQQAWFEFRGLQASDDQFSTPALYKYSRHPMYVGVLMVMWSTPHMTTGHLLLAAIWTVYVFIGIYFEERDLIRQFGDTYREYQARVSKLVPLNILRPRRHVAPDIISASPAKSRFDQH